MPVTSPTQLGKRIRRNFIRPWTNDLSTVAPNSLYANLVPQAFRETHPLVEPALASRVLVWAEAGRLVAEAVPADRLASACLAEGAVELVFLEQDLHWVCGARP